MNPTFNQLPYDEADDRCSQAYAILFEGVDDDDAEYLVSNILRMISEGGPEMSWCWKQIFMMRSAQRQEQLDAERKANNEEI